MLLYHFLFLRIFKAGLFAFEDIDKDAIIKMVKKNYLV